MAQTTFLELIFESDLISLKEELDRVEAHILKNVPAEMLFVPGGNPNTQNRYGALLTHVRYLRATIKAF